MCLSIIFSAERTTERLINKKKYLLLNILIHFKTIYFFSCVTNDPARKISALDKLLDLCYNAYTIARRNDEMSTANKTTFQNNLSEYLQAVISRGEKIQISTDDGSAILISADEYNSLMETLYLNSIPGMSEHILDGRGDNEETFTVDWKNEL